MPREVRIGEAIISFRADVGGFIAGITGADNAVRRKRQALRRLRNELNRFGGSVASATSSVVSLRGAVAALAGTAGIGLLARQSAMLGADLAELSRRSGIAVESLQTLGRVFGGDGIDARTFTLLVERMTRAIGGARQGLGQFTRGFELLDIDVSGLRNAEEAFLRIADSLASGAVDRPTALLALQQLLNRDGRRAFNVLAQGSATIRDQQEAFSRLGVVTTDQANRLKGLSQVYDDFGTALQTQTARLTADLAGLLGGVLQSAIDQIPRVFDAVSRAVRFLVENGEALVHVLTVLFALSLRNTGIVRLSRAFLGAAASVLSLGNAVSVVSRRFTTIHSAPTRFFASLRTGVASATLGFLRLGAAATAAFARVTTGLTVASARTIALRTSTAALGVAARASWGVFAAGAAVATTAIGGVFAGIVSLLGVLRRVLWPIAVIEGILATITFVVDLNNELKSTSVSLTQGLVIAAVRGVGSLLETLGKIPDFMAAVLMAAGAAIRVFYRNATMAAEPFIRGIVQFVDSALRAILAGLNRLPDLVSRALGALLTGVVTAAGSLGEKVGNEVGLGMLRGLLFLTDALQGLFSDLLPDSILRPLREIEQIAERARQRIEQAQAASPGVLKEAVQSAREAFGNETIRPLIEDTRLLQMRILSTAAQAPTVSARATLIEAYNAARNIFSESNVRSIIDGDELSDTVLKRLGFTEDQIREGGAAATRALGTTLESIRRQLDLFRGRTEGVDLPELSFPTTEALDIPEIATAAEGLVPEEAARRNAIEIRNVYEGLTDDLSRAFGEFGRNVVLDFRSIGDAALSLGNAIKDALANALIAAPIQSAVTRFLGGGSGITGFVPALQGGGVGRGLTLVGEGGPELVDFRAPGRVYSNPELQRAISGIENPGQAPTINLTVNSENPGAVRSEILRALPAISDAVSGALAQQVQRRSSEQRVFRG